MVNKKYNKILIKMINIKYNKNLFIKFIEKLKLKRQGYDNYMSEKIIKKMENDGFELIQNFSWCNYFQFKKNDIMIAIKYQKYYPSFYTFYELESYQSIIHFDKTYIVFLEDMKNIDQDFINKKHIYQIKLNNFLKLKIKLHSLKEVNKTYINKLIFQKKSLLEEIKGIDQDFINKKHIYQIKLNNFLKLKIKVRLLKEINKIYINKLIFQKKSLLEEIKGIDKCIKNLEEETKNV